MCPDCFNLWLKILILCKAFKVSRRKTPKSSHQPQVIFPDSYQKKYEIIPIMWLHGEKKSFKELEFKQLRSLD